MAIEKDQLLKYLGDLRAYYATYHNHKEISAWAAIVFAGLLAGPGAGTIATVTINSTPLRVTASVIVVAVLLAVVAYLMEQFRAKAYSANVVAACDFWATFALTVNTEQLRPDDFVVAEADDVRIQAPHVLPKCIRTKADELSKKGQAARKAIESVAYVLVVALFGLVGARIWV